MKYQSFCRLFHLPENVKSDYVKAKYSDGILKVVVPKEKVEKEEKAKMIAVA